MPVYCYKCNSCSEEFEVRHSMSFEHQKCIKCKSDNIFKIPSLSRIRNIRPASPKVGHVVDKYIRDAKEEIDKEKKKLKLEEM